MPLSQSSSKQTFESNVKKEIGEGKSPKQAVAIAYSVKRQNDSTPEYAMSHQSNLPMSLTQQQVKNENIRKRGK